MRALLLRARAFRARHAALIYLTGALLIVVGFALALFVAALAGKAVGFALVASGAAGMGATSRSVGA